MVNIPPIFGKATEIGYISWFADSDCWFGLWTIANASNIRGAWDQPIHGGSSGARAPVADSPSGGTYGDHQSGDLAGDLCAPGIPRLRPGLAKRPRFLPQEPETRVPRLNERNIRSLQVCHVYLQQKKIGHDNDDLKWCKPVKLQLHAIVLCIMCKAQAILELIEKISVDKDMMLNSKWYKHIRGTNLWGGFTSWTVYPQWNGFTWGILEKS